MLGAGIPPVVPSTGHSSADGLALLVSAVVFVALATWMAIRLVRGATDIRQVRQPKVQRPNEQVPA